MQGARVRIRMMIADCGLWIVVAGDRGSGDSGL